MRAALGAWFAQHGSDADTADVIADLTRAAWQAAIKPGVERAAERESRIAELPRLAEWTRTQQREAERLQRAVGGPCAPPAVLPALPLAEAEAELSRATHLAFERMVAESDAARAGESVGWSRLAVGAAIGLGKTEHAVRNIVRLTRERPGIRIAYAVPTHKVARDIQDRLNHEAKRRIAKTWLGATQDDPARPGRKMCRLSELVSTVQGFGGALRDVCGGPKRGWCPHNPAKPDVPPEERCGYRQQPEDDVQVWVIPHALLPSAPPKSLPAFHLLIIDEAPWGSLFGGFDAQGAVQVPIAALTTTPAALSRAGGVEALKYSAAAEALRHGLPGQAGLVKRGSLIEADLTAEAARLCSKLVWKGKDRLHISREVPQGEAVARLKARLGDRTPVKDLARAWQLIAKFLESGEAVAPWTLMAQEMESGAPGLRLRWRQDIEAGWCSAPLLYLDATQEPDVARCWLPDLEVTAAVRARETDVWRAQVFDQSNPKGRLTGGSHEESAALSRRLQRFIEVLAFRYRGRGVGGLDVAVITYKAAAEKLKAVAPNNVAVGHFNALRGFDGWRGVAAIVIIGRPLPSHEEIEIMASVASGRLRGGVGYDRTAEGALLMRDGTGRRVNATVHPDPLVDAFRRQVLTEVEQAEGRGRGVRRSEKTPLISVLLTNHPTGLAVDEALPQAEVLDRLNIVALLAARGIVPDSARGAAAVLADEFEGSRDPSARLRKRLSYSGDSGALARVVEGSGPAAGESVSFPYRDPNMENSHFRAVLSEPPPEAFGSFDAYRYNRAGNRRSALALIDRRQHPNARAALETAIGGELDRFEPARPPEWLARVHQAVWHRSTPVLRLGKAPSPVAALLATDHSSPSAAAPLPVASEVYAIGGTKPVLHVHIFEGTGGRDIQLRRRPGAAWPPTRSAPIRVSAAPMKPEINLSELREALGISRERLRSMMASVSARRLVREKGYELAAAHTLASRVGRERFLAAVALCSARAA
jgi:hypothetical protein